MNDRIPDSDLDSDLPHQDAVDDFVERVRDGDLDGLQRLVLFGSVARATHTSESDVDVLAVVDTDADKHVVEETLRDLAYDTMLQYGTVFSIHAVSESTLDQRADHPFFQHVLDEGQAIYG